MKSKYYFIKGRLTELGKTQIEFAECIGTTQQKLNVTLNHPELREFQISEIVKVAEFLGYDLRDFATYVAGTTTDIPRNAVHTNDSTPNFRLKMTQEEEIDIIATILKSIDEVLCENGLELSIEGKAIVFAHLYETRCQEPSRIKEALSLMQLTNSELFIKGK
jgi:hypothetical protein